MSIVNRGVFAGAVLGAALAGQEPAATGWRLVLQQTQSKIEALRESLDSARADLMARAAGDAVLLARITPKLPEPRQHGYGLLPKVRTDLEFKRVRLHRNEFSVARMVTRSSSVWVDGIQLARQAKSGADLSGLVAQFERLRGQLTYVQGQVSYHRYWQEAVVEHARFFALRNRILRDAGRLKTLIDGDGDSAAIEKLRVLIEAKVAPFQKTAGLRVATAPSGARVLAVRILTDITDDSFLRAFRNAVDAAYNQSSAATTARFRIILTIEKIAAEKLRGGKLPQRGAAIEEKVHLARFPDGALVLTTGAKSTHAFVGRYIQLGTKPMRSRELAHEFGHLLGFSDAYLRGYQGDSAAELGCTLIEWGGLQDNLMGAPAQGRVSPGMVRRLLDAYSPAK